MSSWKVQARQATFVAAGMAVASIGTASLASGDLLVAPTRVVLEGQRSAEVVLSNIGREAATYRVSVELRRMRADGSLQEVDPAQANAVERAMLHMAVVSPRRVRLEPDQPQTVRIGIRPPAAGVTPGEYRAHILFRAIPDEGAAQPSAAAPPPTAEPTPRGVSISLRPIYGITIPLIYRSGALDAQASVSNPRLERNGDQPLLRFDLGRTGTRSLYGNVVVTRPGSSQPLLTVRGISIYTDLEARSVAIPITGEQEASLKGPAVVRYVADADAGAMTLAEATTTLR